MKPIGTKDNRRQVQVMFPEFTSNPVFKELNLSAKVIYCSLLNRIQLSIENDKYQDKDGTAFILFAEKKLAELWGVSQPTVERAIKTLKTFGLIEVVQQGVGVPNKIYVYDFEDFLSEHSSVCTKNESGNSSRNTSVTHQNDGRTAHQNDGHGPSKCGSINNNINNTIEHSKHPVTDVTVCSHAPSAHGHLYTNKFSDINRTLFQVPGKTKTEKNAEKWFKERCTQINGHGFPDDVECALRKFLKCLGETKRAINQISAQSWEMQLEALHQLDPCPDIQKEVIYNAASANYRSMLISIRQSCKFHGIIALVDSKTAEKVQRDLNSACEEEEEF